jgi:hypothetical protein
MAIDLNFDLDDLADELDQYTWERVDMGDDRVCHDCERLSAMPPMSMAEWVEQGLEPGSGATICGDWCRCAMVPADLLQIYPDLKTAGKIVIDDGLLSGEIVNMNTSYKTFAELDDLIIEYGKKLPPEYYAINNVNKRIEFLNDLLGGK